jgi:hypothetical protein
LSFLKEKGQGFPLLSGLGATKHNKNPIRTTIKETLRLCAFARNLAKSSKNKENLEEEFKKDREKEKKHP